jgi:hypothetical protein
LNLRRLFVFSALVILPAIAAAQVTDGIAVDGILPDQDFFQLATCGAAPDSPCKDPIVRWPRSELTISLLTPDRPAPAGFTGSLSDAMDRAVAEINGSGAGIRIRRVTDGWADIRVVPSNIPEGTMLDDMPDLYAAGIMGVGYMSYWWNDREEITSASILISTAITDADLRSVMLEELFQSLGPRFDVESPAYEGLSILSQNSNETVTIAGQDARLLQWLYPVPQ